MDEKNEKPMDELNEKPVGEENEKPADVVNEKLADEKNEKPANKKNKRSKEELLEFIVVIMLGLTAVFTAWASWIGSLHSGNQAANYTLSTNLASEGNSEYNAAIQSYMQDMLLYNDVNNLLIDQYFAEKQNDEGQKEALAWKINEVMYANMRAELAAAVEWALAESDVQGVTVTPFEMEGFTDAYFETAFGLLAQSEEAMAQGQQDNTNGDAYGLVTVIYSVVLFLLGIVGTLDNYKNRRVIVSVACAAFMVATLYMFTIPLPTGFSVLSFFGVN